MVEWATTIVSEKSSGHLDNLSCCQWSLTIATGPEHPGTRPAATATKVAPPLLLPLLVSCLAKKGCCCSPGALSPASTGPGWRCHPWEISAKEERQCGLICYGNSSGSSSRLKRRPPVSELVPYVIDAGMPRPATQRSISKRSQLGLSKQFPGVSPQ